MQTPQPVSAPERAVHYDLLRILACCSVVLLHTSAQNWDSVSVDSVAWQIFNLSNSLTRWAVPAFLMISGALFLDPARPLDVRKLWRVRILRICTAFLFWSAIYTLDALADGEVPREVIGRLFRGKFHMWYLPTVAGLYIASPVVRKFTASRSVTRYYLITAAVFAILLPRSLHMIRCLEIPFLFRYLPDLEETVTNFHFSFGSVYLFYFVLGHYLAEYGLPSLTNRNCGLLGIAGYLATVLLTGWYSRKTGTGVTDFYSLSSLNVLAMSTAVFLLARNRFPQMTLPRHGTALIRTLSKYTFGIYLMHPLVMDILKDLGLHTLSGHPALSVIGVTLATLAVSCLLTALAHRIPLIRAYAV